MSLQICSLWSVTRKILQTRVQLSAHHWLMQDGFLNRPVTRTLVSKVEVYARLRRAAEVEGKGVRHAGCSGQFVNAFPCKHRANPCPHGEYGYKPRLCKHLQEEDPARE